MSNVWKGNRECPTYPSWMWGINPDVVFGKAQKRSQDFIFSSDHGAGPRDIRGSMVLEDPASLARRFKFSK